MDSNKPRLAAKKRSRPQAQAQAPPTTDFAPPLSQRRRKLESLSAHDHAAFIFKNKEEWRAVIPAFIAVGLERNEKCLIIADSSQVDLLREELRRRGVDVEAAEKRGQLAAASPEASYLSKGSFSPENMMSLLKEQTEKALSEGYDAFRVTGDMSWALRSYSGVERLFEYEANLNKDFFPQYPCLGLCQFDRSKFTAAVIKEVILSHPLLIFDGDLYQNFYYFPPEEYFHHRQEEFEVDRWLKNIQSEQLAMVALEETSERFRSLYLNSTIGLYRTTPDGRILLANPALVKMLGYNSFEELAERNLEKDGFEPSYPRTLFLERIEKDGEVFGLESAWKRKDGTVIYVRESAKAIRDSQGRTLYYDGTVEDITAKKIAEDQLRASLAEKEVLLREVHHRVKNNLQVITSLLRLQNRYIDDPRLHELLLASQNRIRSMAMIHEHLYAAPDLARIDFGQYVEKLITHLFVVYGVDCSRVAFEVQASGVHLDLNRAIPCGLIINELVSNSLRHAFPDNRQGRIFVSLKQDETGHFFLLVKDNGVGLPPEIDVENPATFGLQIVSILVRQLDGKLRVIRSHGTTFSLRF